MENWLRKFPLTILFLGVGALCRRQQDAALGSDPCRLCQNPPLDTRLSTVFFRTGWVTWPGVPAGIFGPIKKQKRFIIYIRFSIFVGPRQSVKKSLRFHNPHYNAKTAISIISTCFLDMFFQKAPFSPTETERKQCFFKQKKSVDRFGKVWKDFPKVQIWSFLCLLEHLNSCVMWWWIKSPTGEEAKAAINICP